ncbi:MAG: HEPN domain-containing protein [Candidatus Latescibacteria bacterium]|nr:HEPN domain-containing protein [Candidatus Latescibacterota bacterium]
MWHDYLSKAETNLAAAERDFEHRGCDPCVSRAYFAAFHAALAALLALTDFQRQREYWNHGHIAAEFARRLIHRRKVFSLSLADTLEDLRSRRHQADYESPQTSHKSARQSLGMARQFGEQVKTILQEQRRL